MGDDDWEKMEAERVAAAAAVGFPLMTADTMARGTGGRLFHAHYFDARGGQALAMCGAHPGRSGYWGYYFGVEVTCPRCRRLMKKDKE